MKWLLIALIVIPGTIADVMNAKGMKRNGEVYDFRPRAIFRLIASLGTQSLCQCWRAGHGSFIFRAHGAAFHYQPELRGTRHGVQLRAGNSPGQVHPERTYRVAALGGRFASRLRSAAGISGRVTGEPEVNC